MRDAWYVLWDIFFFFFARSSFCHSIQAVSAGPDAINETPSEFILSHEQPYSGGSVGLLLGHQLDETNVQGLEGVEFNVQQHEYSGPGNVLPSKLEIHVEERPAERDGLGIDDVVCLSRGIRWPFTYSFQILSSRSEVVGGISTSSTSTNLTPAKPLGGSARPLDRLLLGHGDATIGRNSLDSVALNVQNDGLDDIRPSDTSPPSQLVTRVDECAEGRDPGRDDVRVRRSVNRSVLTIYPLILSCNPVLF